MFLWPAEATIPFHFVWVSFALLHGLRSWKLTPTLVMLAVVMGTTTVALVRQEIGWELTEVPLMAAMFLVMVWHSRRRQRAIEALGAAVEREQDFVRDASHKLRTPIAIAQGHTELIRAATSLDTARADADVVIDELANLSRISDRILTLVAAEHPSNLRLEPIAAGDLLQRTLSRWCVAADREWEIDIDGDRVLQIDRDQVAAALDAVLENAVKHTRAGDTIRLGVRRSGTGVVIEVEDTGTGVAPEDLPHVFERFYGRGSGHRRGTGLGLAIVKTVMEAHHGRASIDSTLGMGTTVRLHLPASRASAPMAAAARTS